MRFDTVRHDILFALRTMRKNPGFTATALAALAIGIGANTAVFSVVNAVLLKPLDYPDPDRIVLFHVKTPNGPVYGASATKFNAWRGQIGVFQDVAAYEFNVAQLNMTAGGLPEQVYGIRVSADYFRLLGAPILKGRTFTAEEDRPGGANVVVLSYGLWQRRFAADPQIPGKTILLGGAPYTAIGVLGRGFNTELDTPPDVILPFQIDPNSTDQAHYFNVIARLKPAISIATANASLQVASAEFHARYSNILGPHDSFAVEPFQDSIVSDVRPSLLVLAGAVSLVLLIACANVANLLLVRATARQREIAIRTAIGAGRGRIIGQLLLESVVLSTAGGVLGIGLGFLGVRALLMLDTGDIPRVSMHGASIAIDWRVLAFTIAVSLVTGVLFGLIPALDASRSELAAALKQTGGRSGTGRRQNRTRATFVAGQVALALVLLIGAALLIRTFAALRAVNPGFDARNVLTIRMSLTGAHFHTTAQLNQLVRDAVQRIEALPGVERVAASYNLPLEGFFGVPFNIVGGAAGSGRYDGRGWSSVSPGYFDAFKIPLVRGRLFTSRDDAGAAPVAIINQAMARRFWPHGDPLRGRVLLGQGYGPEFAESSRQIIGVVGDVHDSGLNRNPEPVVYVPLAQVTDGITSLAARASTLAWIVRTRATDRALMSRLVNELQAAAGGLPVARVRSMDDIVAASTSRADFNMSLLTIFGCAALLLAAIGVYGLMAYSVRQRTQELGIRMALGAGTLRVRNMIVLQGMRLTLIGVAIGVAAALALTRLIASFLFGVQPRDPLVFLVVPALLCLVNLLAVWIPAIRAARIDPVQALRAE